MVMVSMILTWPRRSWWSPEPQTNPSEIKSARRPAPAIIVILDRRVSESAKSRKACQRSSPFSGPASWTEVMPKLSSSRLAAVTPCRILFRLRLMSTLSDRKADISSSTPVGSLLASLSITPSTGSGVSALMPAICSPTLFSTVACPERWSRRTGWRGEILSKSCRVGCRRSSNARSS